MPDHPHSRSDWTRSSAKWFAVLVLGGASIFGMAWSIRATNARARAAGIDVERRIDINAAGASELQLLPGIGPTLAERIVADRLERGPFSTLDDLARVEGVGPRTIADLRPFAHVDNP